MTGLRSALERYPCAKGSVTSISIRRGGSPTSSPSWRSARPRPSPRSWRWSGRHCHPIGTHSWALRLTDVRCFVRHVANIDPETEVPPAGILPPLKRAKPYVYSDAEIDALLAAALALPPANGLRRWTYHYLFGLIAVIIRDISLCPAGSARRGTSIATGENIRRRPW
jgi:hypothetical protein